MVTVVDLLGWLAALWCWWCSVHTRGFHRQGVQHVDFNANGTLIASVGMDPQVPPTTYHPLQAMYQSMSRG